MAKEFARVDVASHTEGRVAKTIEDQTAKLPSDTFLWLAIGSMVASASLQIMGNRQVSVFVGQWAPTFLILGVYNKLVKQLGSDRTENAVQNGPARNDVQTRELTALLIASSLITFDGTAVTTALAAVGNGLGVGFRSSNGSATPRC